MEEQKINFKIEQFPRLPESVLEDIEEGLIQAKNGLTISFEEFKSKHFKSKCSLKVRKSEVRRLGAQKTTLDKPLSQAN